MNAIPTTNRHLLALVPACLLAFACSATVNAPSAPGCSTDSSVSCPGGGSGYSCGNGDNPETSNGNLECSDGVADNGLTDYCCIEFTSTTCSPDENVGGCTGDSYGFSCTGSDSPDEADSSLTCGPGVAGPGNLTLFCCQ